MFEEVAYGCCFPQEAACRVEILRLARAVWVPAPCKVPWLQCLQEDSWSRTRSTVAASFGLAHAQRLLIWSLQLGLCVLAFLVRVAGDVNNWQKGCR